MPFWILLAVQAALTVIGSVIKSRSQQQLKPLTPDVPDVNPGDPVPLAFGYVKVPVRPVDFSAGDWRAVPIRKGPRAFLGIIGQRPIVGYQYRASFVGLLCHGPAQTFEDLIVDGKSVTGAGTQQRSSISMTGFPPVVTYTPVGNALRVGTASGEAGIQFDGMITIPFYVPTLLGGDEANGNGGIEGSMIFRNGLGHGTVVPELVARHATTPDWRAFVYLYFDDVYLGNSAQLPSMHAVVVRTPRAPFVNPIVDSAGGPDSDLDANPAAILWELLTDTETGLGLPEDVLDSAGFSTLAAACSSTQNKAFGLSFVIEQETSAQRVIEDVLRTLDAVLVTDPTTGKLTPKLIRTAADPTYGYSDPAALVQLTPANVSAVKFTPPQPATRVNAIRVAYSDRKRQWQRNTVTATDHALVATMGQTIVQEVEFLGCTTETLAGRLAARELRAVTTPLARATAYCDRSPAALVPGQFARLTWPEYGISNKVMRVVEVDWGTLEDPRVTIDLVDDVFALPASDATVFVTDTWVPSIPAIGVTVPVVESLITQAALTASIKLLVIDPQSRVTASQWRTYAKRATAPAYGALTGAGPGYVQAVTLSAVDDTVVEWQITWTDANGVSQTTTDSVTLTGSVTLSPPILSLSWASPTSVVVTAAPGDTVALNGVRFASGTTDPTDANVIAGALDASAPFTATVTVPSGTIRYIGARSEATVNGEAIVSPIVRRELFQVSSLSPSITIPLPEIGNGANVLNVSEREMIVWVDIGSISLTGWTLSADVSGSLVLKVETATIGAFPTFTEIFGSERATLTAARSAEFTLTTPVSITTKVAFRITVVSAATVTAASLSLHGKRV
jgi:hypothetical protein